uniref:PGG domain-containing protein n=1 Tax=Oryza punctata TaxID=4537 RepID=A0A0E0KYZ1_ORYPU
MNQPHEPAGSESTENVHQNIKEDDEYVNNKRGWLMTVATLFVGMAFQAAIQLPAWFPDDWPQAFSSYNMKHSGILRAKAHPSPTSSQQHAATALTKGQMRGIRWYIMFNTVTFTTALAFLITLLAVGRSLARHSIRLMNSILFTLIISTSVTFVLAISSDWTVVRWMLLVLLLLGSYTLFICLAWPKIIKNRNDKKSRREAQLNTAPPP